MPRKKELPAPDSGEQDDLLSTEPQESPDGRSPSRRRNPSPQKARPMKVRRMKMCHRRNTRNFFRR